MSMNKFINIVNLNVQLIALKIFFLLNCKILKSTINYDQYYQFDLNKIYFTEITYSAKILFIQLVISIANILSLWHGISFIGLIQTIIRHFEHGDKMKLLINVVKNLVLKNINMINFGNNIKVNIL